MRSRVDRARAMRMIRRIDIEVVASVVLLFVLWYALRFTLDLPDLLLLLIAAVAGGLIHGIISRWLRLRKQGRNAVGEAVDGRATADATGHQRRAGSPRLSARSLMAF